MKKTITYLSKPMVAGSLKSFLLLSILFLGNTALAKCIDLHRNGASLGFEFGVTTQLYA
jgi:hypothetical protein